MQITASHRNGAGCGQRWELMAHTKFFVTYILRMLRIGAMALRRRSARFPALPFGCLAARRALAIPMRVIGIRGELEGAKRGA